MHGDRLNGPSGRRSRMLNRVGVDGQTVDRGIAVFPVLLGKNFSVDSPASRGGTDVGVCGAVLVQHECSAADTRDHLAHALSPTDWYFVSHPASISSSCQNC